MPEYDGQSQISDVNGEYRKSRTVWAHQCEITGCCKKYGDRVAGARDQLHMAGPQLRTHGSSDNASMLFTAWE
jgi:hypothetical protein